MASNYDLAKDEIIGRAARLRGVSPEKFIEDVRRISNGRGMCAHSRDYFFRPSNVRTLSETARPEKGSRDRMERGEESLLGGYGFFGYLPGSMRDDLAVALTGLMVFGEVADQKGFRDEITARYLFDALFGDYGYGFDNKDTLLKIIEQSRAASFTLSTFVHLIALKYVSLVNKEDKKKITKQAAEVLKSIPKRRSVRLAGAAEKEGEKK